jgi:DNA-binding MarR family transcriptional regulator
MVPYVIFVRFGTVPDGTFKTGRNMRKKTKKNTDNRVSRMLSLLNCAHANIKSRMMDKAAGMGFSMPQFMTLIELYRHDGITMHELSEKLNLPKSSVSRITDQLVKKGMVESIRPSDNRRTVRLSVTGSFRKNKLRIMGMVTGDINKKTGRAKAEKIIEALEELCDIVKYEKNTTLHLR